MAICSSCGAQNSDDARFCEACGARLEEIVKATPVSEMPEKDEFVPAPEPEPEDDDEMPEELRKEFDQNRHGVTS